MDTDDRIKRLLDGQLDHEEIASDPVLSSLAERIFGLTIEPMTPTKGSAVEPSAEESIETPTSNSMIEVIPASPSIPQPMPALSTLEPIPKDVEETKSISKLGIFGFLGLILSVSNLFGAFGFLNSQCSGDLCTSEATRLNWLGIHNITNEMGWSMPFPEIGIPDYVAIGMSLLFIIISIVRK